ncbi:helix-turn-helix domain-containing protein [Salinicoccus carnicancri]|uniref:helix-turn-helix domain-containing protein n=1 Tax=Salinicoccus carnicancri TaxID=558170 RepID=UPI0002EE8732|nr:helix-turn-helix domain-containing protein [Salinicoccus carnicancri]
MNLEKYIGYFIGKEFGDAEHQIWKFRGTGERAEILEGETVREDGGVPACRADSGRYCMEKYDASTELHFCYLDKKGIVLRIFKHINAVDEWVMEHLYHSLHSIILEDELKMKTTEQQMMIESMHSISSSLELDQVLKTIIRHALNVIPTSDAGFLMLYDPYRQKLIPKVQVGFNERIYQFETRVGESITGKVFEDGRSRVYNSYDELIAEMRAYNILPENYDSILQSTGTPGMVDGAICVPVSIDEKRIGVMIVHQGRMKKRLGQEDVTLLEAFSRQAAIAIENAQYHAETEERLQQITDLSGQLAEKNNQLQKRQEVHHTLTMLSIQNKGINVVVDGMQNMIDLELIFFNGLENDFYSPGKNEKACFSVFEIKVLCLERHRDFYTVTDDGDRYYLYPIFNGQVFIGCLIILVDRPMSEIEQITIEQGTTVLALELVNWQTATKIYHRRVYEQFRKLLAYGDNEQLVEYGKELNLNVKGYWSVAVLEIVNAQNDLQYLEIHIHQLASRLSKKLGDSVKLVYGFYNKIILLLSLSGTEEVYDIKDELNEIGVQEQTKESTLVRGGISGVYKGLEYINKCYGEANKIISYLASRDSLEVILYEDIGLNRLFLNQPAEDINHFIEETLSPLTVDNSRYKELEKTLDAYMETNRSPGKTAKLVHIHINTLYQRLRTIEELLDIDLNDSQDMLKIQLACHLKNSQPGLEDAHG